MYSQCMPEICGIKSVNWHITAKCNYQCKFCFSRWLDEEVTSINEVEEILQHLKKIGMEKLTFVGGEPMLHPLIFDMVKMAKGLGFVVSIVSNGSLLTKEIIWKLKPHVDWIGLSIDSAENTIETALGRGNGSHVHHILELAQIIHDAGIKLKINTTVTKLNWKEDMRPLVRKLKPQRWKVFQVLHIEGQNDLHFDELSITEEQFGYFKSLNSERLESSAVFEKNNQMLASYFMVSPSGRAMSNMDGAYKTFESIETITDLSQVIDPEKYFGRDGLYDW